MIPEQLSAEAIRPSRERNYNGRVDDDQPIDRRALFGLVASGLASVLAACGPAGAATTIVQTSEGRVLQWERDNMTVLVSGLQEQYQPGQQVRLIVLLNNHALVPATARVRTRLLGRGQQSVVEAEVVSVAISPDEVARVERTLDLPRSLSPGDYTLAVELPPWRLERRDVGGGKLTADVKIAR